MPKRIGIVGGGITGMTMAYDLSQKGYSVTLFEKDDDLGGLAGSFEIGGTPVEKFYHHIFASDEYAVALLKELGIEKKMLWAPGNIGIYSEGCIYPFNSALDLLRFKPLSLINRIRLGLGIFRARQMNNVLELDRMNVKEFAIRLMGEAAYKTVWEPLFKSKFEEEANHISAAWFWKKLNIRKKNKGPEILGYLDGGFKQLFDALEKMLLELKVEILRTTPANQIVVENGKIQGIVSQGTMHPFDLVVFTAAIPLFKKLVPELPNPYSENLSKIKYRGAICLVLRLKHPLSNIYWLNINDKTIPFVGVIEHTNFCEKKTYGDSHVAYLIRYVGENDRFYNLSKSEVLREYFPHLKKIFPSIEESWILDTYLWKEKYAQPVMATHYLETIPGSSTPVKNLYLATMAQIYPEDRGMNYGIRMAKQAVDTIVSAHQP
jgi:protoporphyrinogen oxidase